MSALIGQADRLGWREESLYWDGELDNKEQGGGEGSLLREVELDNKEQGGGKGSLLREGELNNKWIGGEGSLQGELDTEQRGGVGV